MIKWLMLFCISFLSCIVCIVAEHKLIWAPNLGAETGIPGSDSLWICHWEIYTFYVGIYLRRALSNVENKVANIVLRGVYEKSILGGCTFYNLFSISLQISVQLIPFHYASKL